MSKSPKEDSFLIKIQSKKIFITSIPIILFSAVAMITNHQGVAQKLLEIVFWIFLLGFFLYIWELKNE